MTDSTMNICSYCLSEITRGNQAVICSKCKRTYHRDCWEENGSCSIYGCGSRSYKNLTLQFQGDSFEIGLRSKRPHINIGEDEFAARGPGVQQSNTSAPWERSAGAGSSRDYTAAPSGNSAMSDISESFSECCGCLITASALMFCLSSSAPLCMGC